MKFFKVGDKVTLSKYGAVYPEISDYSSLDSIPLNTPLLITEVVESPIENRTLWLSLKGYTYCHLADKFELYSNEKIFEIF